MFESITIGVIIGLWAFLWCSELTMPGEVFSFVRRWMNGLKNESLRKILIDCPKCHAGQLAFWWFFANDINHLFIGVTMAIFTAYLLEKYII